MIGLDWIGRAAFFKIKSGQKNQTRLCMYMLARLSNLSSEVPSFLISDLSLQGLSPSWQAGSGGEGEKMSLFCFFLSFF